MSLTIGRAPFGRQRAGHFDFEVPATVTYVEPFPRRVRGMKGGATVVDSDRVLLVFRTGTIPHWAFLPEDVTIDARPDTAAPGYVRVEWDAADEWWEEDERVFVHVRDPYTRVDCYPTSRHVRVTVGDTVVAESTRAVALYETGLPTRYYLPRDDVRMELLEPSATVTQCPYKGTANHWSTRDGVADVGWSYDDHVLRESEAIRGRLCFYDEKATIEIS